MLVYVLDKNGNPLMPCKPAKARKLLRKEKARVVSRLPFTIKLLHGSSGYKQPIVGGMDTGSKAIGCAAVANGQVVYQAEVTIRNNVTRKMKQRAMYRSSRRSRKCRYRPARWQNRSSMGANGRLAPSVLSKLNSHLRERNQVEAILPITRWKVETASFDIHKISNPDVSDYQDGRLKGFYNLKAYVLHRDNYKCQSGQKIKHSDKLHIHHKIFRSNGGSDTPDNLITLCEQCHSDLHDGKFELKWRKSRTKHATQMGVIKSRLKKEWYFEEEFGYATKYKRERILKLDKSHSNDAVAICCVDGEMVTFSPTLYLKRHVSKGDYQQTKGRRSEKRMPTGKLFGLRKHDYVSTEKGVGFVKGKRRTGYFALGTITGETIHTSVNIKKDTKRLSARTTTLTERSTITLPLPQE